MNPNPAQDDPGDVEGTGDPGPADPAPAADDAALEALRRERDEIRDHYQRALADMENVRKRHRREMAESRQYGIAELARELLGVTDNLERALAGVPAERADDPLVAGVRLILDQFRHTLAAHGVQPVEALGQRFDPMVHEAISQDERSDVEPGTVTDELVRGYKLGDRLLRAAMVRVAGPPSGARGGRAEAGADPDDDEPRSRATE